MLIIPDNLQILFTGINSQLTAAYLKQKPWYSKICSVMPSRTEREIYNWMLTIPTLREWVGPRFVANAALKSYEIENKPFELTIGMDKWKIADDQYGSFSWIAQEAGTQAAKWPDYQVVAAIEENPVLPWSGKAFFASDQPTFDEAGSTYSNALSQTLDAAGFNTVRSTMMAYKGADGKPLGIVPDLLIVPPALEVAAKSLMNSTFIAPQTFPAGTNVGSQSNVLQGMADVLVIPELTSDTGWYLACTNRVIKPFIWQIRQSPEIIWRNSPTDPAVFDLHQFLIGVESRGAAGFSFPFLCARGHT